MLSWRYSLGNAYAHFSWELLDVGEVMGAYGYPGVERAILDKALRAPTLFPNRSAGERMVGCVRLPPPLRRHQLRRPGDAALPAGHRVVRAPARRVGGDGPAAPRALRRRHPRPDLRPPRAGARAAGPASDRGSLDANRPAAARGPGDCSRRPARGGASQRRRRVRGPAPRRVAVHPDRARGRAGAPLRRADRHEARRATGTWSCRTCSPPGSSGPGAPRRPACCATC